MSVLSIYKPIGKTPLDIINELKNQKKYKNTKMSYVGRLDPMAHGLQLIVTNELCQHREKYLNFDKIYEFSICFGIQTDTYDMLGNITNVNLSNNKYSNNKVIIRNILDKFKGLMTQEYPPYSAKRVNGKPLWYYSKNNISITLPMHDIEIYSLQYLEVIDITLEDFVKDIIGKINKININYDFRQQKIIEKWSQFLESNNHYPEKIMILKLKAHVSSGTYIRVLVRDICKYLGIIGMTSDIFRTNVGTYQF